MKQRIRKNKRESRFAGFFWRRAKTADIPRRIPLALLALCVCMGLFIPVAGLAVNLWLPRLDCENDTIVVKQSASSMIGIFGGMLVVGLGALLWAVGGKLLGFVWFSLAAAAVLLAGAALGWHWLCGSGARILQKL